MSLQIDTLGSDPESWIGSITYRSTASAKPSAAEIDELTAKAQAKNHRLGLTGMLLYQEGEFLQTLEGNPANLEKVWSSIRRDPRHCNIDVLSEHIVPARLFSGWDLLVCDRENDTPVSAQKGTAQHRVRQGLAHTVPMVVDLALNGDDLGLNRLIAALAEEGWTGDAVLMHLLEPTARALGDAWLADECSEFDLTIGLSMLQLAGHAVRHSPTPDAIRKSKYSILLATAPGENHGLGTSMLADLFTDAGWHVDMAFPGSNEALAKQLGAQQPDAVDIGMSDALPRHHNLGHLRETILQSRFAAPDHLTVVSVGGRMFAEAAATAESVGADYARETVVGSSLRIAELIRQKRQEPGAD